MLTLALNRRFLFGVAYIIILLMLGSGAYPQVNPIYNVVNSIQKRQSKPMRNRKGAGISLLGLKAGIGATWLEGFAGSAYFFAGDGRVTGVG